MGAIRWPTAPFTIRARPLGWIGKLIAWINLLAGAGVLAFLTQIDTFQQIGANLIASTGIGETITEIRVGKIDCTHWSGNRGGVYHCDVALVGPNGAAQELPVSSSFDLEKREPPRVARVFGRTALGYPYWLILVDLFPIALAVFFCGGMVFLGWFMLGGGAWLVRRRFHDARIVEVDLLRRKMRNEILADWDFAYDDAGRRRYARDAIASWPVLLDGVVTRGAALVPKRGKARLLTRDFHPLDIDPAKLAELIGEIDASFHTPRPLLPTNFSDCVSGFAPGPEADYVEGWYWAYCGPEVERVNAGIEQRHRAALQLKPERVDALLRRCRECGRA